MGTNRLFFRLLAQEDIKQIDLTGRRILEEVGIRILDDGLVRRIESEGARVDRENQRIYLDGGLLDELIAKAPRRFILYSRDGRNNIHLGEGRVHFANGGRVFRILDMGTRGYRSTMLRDIVQSAVLVDNLEYISFYIIACQAHDVEPESYHLNDFFHSFNRTAKHVMGGCTNLEGARQVWDLASLIAGGEEELTEKPLVSIITNPISPLTIDADTSDILSFCAQRGIPITCAPAPIAGATAPVTLAGTLSQMHAEALAGVALTQLFSPGARVLYGAVPSTMDMRQIEFTFGSVEMAMMNAAAVQLAKIYDLPVYGSGGVTEAKRPDIQAGSEKTFSNLMVAMSGADCVHLAAGILDSGNSISYEQYIIDNEIIGMIHKILSNIRVDNNTLGFDVIKKVGPGGNYVMEDHTIEHMMDEFYYPELSVRCIFDIWETKGRPSMLSRSNERVLEILEKRREGLLDMDLISRIKKAFPHIRDI
jgi:trimethylamine--corrinoid protein Co-methyltransferase